MANPDQVSPLKDVQNILGFLLAGFGGVLGFLGLRSSEVTTVLRNDSPQASLIALILLFAILAAVLGVVSSGHNTVPLLRVCPVFLALLGIGALVVFAIPVGSGYFNVHGILSIAVGIVFMAIAVIAWRARPTEDLMIAVEPPKGLRGLLTSVRVRWPVAFIVASVMLFATSIYGAMRLEADSQGTSSVQISADIASSESRTPLTVHVTGFKIKASEYVGLTISGLPGYLSIQAECASVSNRDGISVTQCARAPCYYLSQFCVPIILATFPADAGGDINEKLSDALVPGVYQDISIQAVVCQLQQKKSCVPRSGASSNSHLDIHLSQQPAVP